MTGRGPLLNDPAPIGIGGKPYLMIGPSPAPLSPWQTAQLIEKRMCPLRIDGSSLATGFAIADIESIAPCVGARPYANPGAALP